MAIIAEPDDLIGDDKTPSTQDVQHMVTSLIELYESMIRKPPSKTRVIDIHNIYSLYVLQFFSFSTAYRGVRSPFQNISDYNSNYCLMIISDKDDIDGYMTRVAHVSEKLDMQLRYYQKHCNQLINEIELFNPSSDIVKAARENIFPHYLKLLNSPDEKERAVLDNMSHRDRCFPFFFFLSDRKQFKEVRPSSYLDLSPVDWLRGDSGRHFFRSSLVWSECSTEVIDAAMGHWEHGNEPYGPYSCMSPNFVCERIKKHADQIVDECGWRVIECLT